MQGATSRSGCFGEVNLLSLAGMEPRPIHCPLCSLVTILTELPRSNSGGGRGGGGGVFAERPESDP